jgi:hypothetical protein
MNSFCARSRRQREAPRRAVAMEWFRGRAFCCSAAVALCDQRPCNLRLPRDYNKTKQQARIHLQTLSQGFYPHEGFN